MTYNKESKILSVRDVKAFFNYLVCVRKVSFHPDESFEDYVSFESGIKTFSYEECVIFNRLMDECFKICEAEGVDIYEIGIELLKSNVFK